MSVAKWIRASSLAVVVLLAGCPVSTTDCPVGTVIPGAIEIPEGESQTSISVRVDNINPALGFGIVTELTADSGSIDDPFASETTYNCAFDVAGEVEVCINVMYVDTDAGVPDAGSAEVGASANALVGSTTSYLRKPHIRLSQPLECSETECTTVVCPAEKNQCPAISEFSAELTQVDGNTATLTVAAEDPDENPDPLTTLWSAGVGTIEDASSGVATYTCDPNVGGAMEVCVVASDGDPACDVTRCTTVLCPGEPQTNTCPVIASFTASPTVIPPGDTLADIVIDVSDPDLFPQPLRTQLRSETGVFDDRFTTQTTFRCGDSGPVELCVEALDGDDACDQERCITVQCPSDIPDNLCPMLFVLNAIPSVIPEGQTSTLVQSRGQDTDALPIPLELSLRALWGTISDDENIQEPNNVVSQDATYTCDRPGETEICVDATDGACEKTLCIEVDCPSDIPAP
ncbi:MAG: hypothetical protein WBG86_17775 [Polyangiales bacterium]